VPMRLTRFRSIMYYAFQEQFKYSSCSIITCAERAACLGSSPLFFDRAHR